MSGDAFEGLRADLSATFLNLSADQVQRHVADGLGRIAGVLDLERVILYELSDGQTELMATAWARDEQGAAPPITKTDDPARWTMLLDRSGELSIPDPGAPPEIWAASVPLRIGGETIGAMEVASTSRHQPPIDELVARLTTLAEVFSNALSRKRTAHALFVNRTELQKVRAEAREHSERFRLVADTAPVLVWMSDTNRLCTYFNTPWLDFVGRPLSAELGHGWANGVHPEDLAACLETVARAFDQRERYTVRYRLRRHDGEYRWVLATSVPRFDRHGVFAGYIGSGIDITNEKLAEEASAALGGRLMEAQEQERSRIAHELHDDICQRITLLAIELQQLNDDSPVEIRARLEDLFNRTVDISADVQALSHQLHCSKIEYLGIVAAMRGLCVELTRQRENATIEFTASGVPTHLPRDVSLCLFRVLQEGLRNAFEHSGVQHVEADLHGTSSMVLLTIRDRGRGFEPEIAMHGHGLGLISMRERVSLVNGRILVVSKPGWGTEISLRIPIDTRSHGKGRSLGAGKHSDLVPVAHHS